MEWQPISTRPTNNESYLLANREKGFVVPVVNGIIQCNTGTKWDWDFGDYATHWMPLPDAPK